MTTPAPSISHRSTPPALSPERPVEWPKRTVRTLPNGLQVVLAESRTFPKISAQLYFRSGNAVVALRAPGLAEMTATVVRTGTTSRPSRQIEEDLRRMGAGLGTSSGADSSAISASGLAEFSAEILALIADLARNASFPENEFERERRQRFEELKIERTTPGFLANERLRKVLFGLHPYAIISPTEEQVASYRREQLEEFYHQRYVPSDALLIVVGDFSTGAMLEQIEKVFGDWKAPKPATPESPAPPRQSGRRVHLVHMPGTVQTQVLLGNLAITRRDPDWYRTVLANSIYGGAFHSRLVINIREQKGYTYSPRSGISALRQLGFFTVHAAVRNDVAAATLTEMFYEMDRMRSLPVTPEELDSARSYLTGVFSLGVATQDGLLGQLSTVYLDQLPESYLETYREKIRALTADDVVAAARRHFDSANAQIVLVGDRAQIGEQAALFGPVTEYDAQGNVAAFGPGDTRA
ncbi:MAG TPA: pitrilysin family protein [Candidatus Acidoferrales bacterium]|nr:pitrilysin family protein [Candidatus Acidoferrales bacterium]